MIKKINVLLIICSLLVMPSLALADTFNYGYFGTTSISKKIVADGTQVDDTWIDVTVQGGSGQVLWYGKGENEVIGTSPTPGTVKAPSGAFAMGLKSLDGSEVYAIVGHTTNPIASTISFTGSNGSGSDSGGSDGGGCSDCGMFSCPGWDEYMGKLNQIMGKIPPAPDWNEVAKTFTNTIAPRFKADLEDVLGRVTSPPAVPRAPEVPSAPRPEEIEKPAIPEQLGGLDDRGIEAPTGKEAPGLGDAGFNLDDIKKDSPKIPVREDPTGGFTILDPIEKLPSQDEFMQNLPKPEEGESSIPKEQENKAPSPKDEDYTAPSPKDEDYAAPSPKDEDYAAPSPKDEDYAAPSPKDEEYTAPTAPKDKENNAPIPGGGSSGDYLPPMPEDILNAPIPKPGTETPPIPGK